MGIKIYAFTMIREKEDLTVDWSGCDLVERVPGRVGGVPVVKGTRLQADAVVVNYAHGSPIDEIMENFEIREDVIRGLLQYAAMQVKLLIL